MAFALLAPYNDSMHLGQGFNSFLQEPCMDGAVSIDESKAQAQSQSSGQGNVSQVVSYNSRFVEKISDVVRSMNISAAASIKSGTVQVSGNSISVDEVKFAASDINAVISVKVINQTISSPPDAKFVELDPNIKLNGEQFFQLYGDCYISGFLQGGDLHGIVSMKVLDSSKKSDVETALKSAINGATGDFVLSEGSASSALESWMSQTESTVTVNWSGGGQIKPDEEEWTLESLIRAASSFPSRVAACPQRTFAILTPYTRNRDFMKWAIKENITTPNFTRIQQTTHDLLDNYMLYKSNLAILQGAISNPLAYRVSEYNNAINLNFKTLLDERKAMKLEMRKISDVISKLNRNPSTEITEEFESPELWATRLPVLIEEGKGSKTLSQDDTELLISGFSFVEPVLEKAGKTGQPVTQSPSTQQSGNSQAQTPVTSIPSSTGTQAAVPPGTSAEAAQAELEDTTDKLFEEAEKRRKEMEKNAPPPPPPAKPELANLYRSSAASELTTTDAAFLNLEANRLKYAKYRFEAPLGREGGGRFNDAEVLEGNPLLPTSWPKKMIFFMRAWNDEYALCQVTTQYQHHNMTWGQGSTNYKNLTIDFKEGEMINQITLGRSGSESGIQAVSYVEVVTTTNRSLSVGYAEAKAKQIFKPFDGAIGLKGFWGMRGDVLDMLGPIWGLP